MPNLEPPWLSHFIVELIVSQVLFGRVHRGHRMDQPEVILVLDEGDDDVSRASEAAYPQGRLSPLSRILRQGREFGIGVFVGVGALDPVSLHILNSMTHHFIFKMSDAASRVAAASALDLPNGADGLIPVLDPGECLVRTPSWPHAVLGKIDFVAPCRGVEPQYVANLHVPAQRLQDMPAALEAADKLIAEHRKGQQRRAQQQHAGLRPLARKLLHIASLNPYWPVARLYELMGKPAPAIQKAIRAELNDQEYAAFELVRLGKRNVLLIELLGPAWALLGVPPVKLQGRGTLAHRTFAAWIAMVGERRAYEAKREWIVPGTSHPADVAWKVGESWEVFVVVVTCEKNLADHFKAIFVQSQCSIAKATVVAAQKGKLGGLKSQIASCSEFTGQIEYLPVEVFEQELWP